MQNIFTAVPRVVGIFRKYLGAEIFLIFFLAASAGILDGIGILLVLPLLEVISGGQPSEASEYILSVFSFFGIGANVENILIGMVLIFFLKGLALFYSLERVAFFRGKLLLKLKSRLAGAYEKMTSNYYSSKDAGYFTNILNDQVNRCLLAFLSICQLIGHVVNAFIYIVLAFVVAWRFGLMAVSLGIILLTGFRFLNKILAAVALNNSRESARLTSRMVEFVQGFKYFKATSKFSSVLPHIRNSIERLSGYEVTNGRATALTQSVREPIAVLFIASIMAVQLVYLNQPVEPIFVSIILFYRCLNSLIQIQAYWQNTLEYSGGLRMVDNELSILTKNSEDLVGGERINTLSSFEFKDFNFIYNGANSKALDSISFRFEASGSYAVVGRSGSGKSTLVDAICLLNQGESGSFFINDQDCQNINKPSWRGKIGYVPQFPVLIDGTVKENICLNHPVDADKIQKCIEAAGLKSDVQEFDAGLETFVGDRGMSLSGGQRQRLAIARELYTEPALLIMDEATSALDGHSESMIVETIKALKKKTCVVVVAHKLETIKAVDDVLVLDAGKIAEVGRVGELLSVKTSKFSMLFEERSR